MPDPAQRRNGHRSHADRVYVELRARLLRGELPADRRLVEEQLAAEFETSRTPIREALRRLEGDGHLVRGPGGSLRPSVPEVASMTDLYEVRIAVEELCVRRAAAHGDRADLEALRSEWSGLAERWPGPAVRGPDFVHADERFHLRLARAGGNEPAERILADVNERIRRLRIHDFTSQDRVRATIAEHLEILAAVLSGDADAAAAFMRAHVQRSALVVRERVAVALARMGDDAVDPG